jgi:hypothetical protein
MRRGTFRLPEMQGLIRRRILINFCVDAEVMKRQLPEPFRPKLLDGAAVAGICLIRLERIRPVHCPAMIGLASENAAHRVAVWWTEPNGEYREGVYIPRRDSSSLINHLVGGRLFPGEHHRAAFDVQDDGEQIELSLRSMDGQVSVDLRTKVSEQLPPSSRFPSLEAASTFFEKGALGYSQTARGDRLDGLYLATKNWLVKPLEVERVHSSFFSDESLFPPGSVSFDCGLLMRDVEHSWQSVPALQLASQEQATGQRVQ